MRRLDVLFLPHPNETLARWNDEVTDLRMAAYTVAITDIANSYSALGL